DLGLAVVVFVIIWSMERQNRARAQHQPETASQFVFVHHTVVSLSLKEKSSHCIENTSGSLNRQDKTALSTAAGQSFSNVEPKTSRKRSEKVVVSQGRRFPYSMTTQEIAQELVDLCSQGKFREATDALYSPDIVSVEAGAPPG